MTKLQAVAGDVFLICLSRNAIVPSVPDSKQFKTIELVSTNSVDVKAEILKTLNELYDNDTSSFKNIKLLISYATPYALRVDRLLTGTIPGLKHATCLYHAGYNLCETITNESFEVNILVSWLKRKSVKKQNKSRIFQGYNKIEHSYVTHNH